MSAEKFLDRLEEQGLLDDKIISELRGQVAKKPKKVTPEAIAKLLVDNGHLTRFQASKLVSDSREVGEPESAGTTTATEEDDLGFAPEGDELAGLLAGDKAKPSRPASPAPTPTPAKTPAKTPTKSPSKSSTTKPVAPPPALAEDDDEIVELEAAPAEPAPAKRSSAPPAAAPAPRRPSGPPPPVIGGGLQPLDGLEPIGGGLQPMDGGLEPLGGGLQPLGGGLQPLGGGLEPMGGGLDPYGHQPQAGLQPMGPTAPAHPQAKPGAGRAAVAEPRNQWDSKLLLIGGAILMLLGVAFVVLYFAVFQGSAQETYDLAAEDYRQGSYTQAIKKFELFLKRYPSNTLAKSAEIKIGMARLWQSVEGSADPERSLRTAQEVLPKIAAIAPEVFETEAREELSGLLPEIAERFSNKAVSAQSTEDAEKLVGLTNEAMELVDSPMYIPGSRRKTLEARINGIKENLERVQQGIRQDRRLIEAIGEIQTHVEAGDTNQAYSVYKELLRQFPGVERNAELRKTVLSITERVRQLAKVLEEPVAATTEDVERPPTKSVILANRHGETVAGVDGQVAYVLARGAVYGLEASTGRVLWRRFVGYETLIFPQPINGQPGADCLLVDQRRHELLRIKATTGELVWRQVLGQPFATPFILNSKVFVAENSGRLLEIDAETGESTRHVLLPQPPAVGPTADDKRPQLYLVGEHSNLFVLSTDTLAVSEVVYLGQKTGSVVVPPAMALGYLFVVENLGKNDALVHILSTNASGLEVKTAQKPLRLTGNVLVPPQVMGRRVLLVSDRGEIRVLDVDPNAETPVSEVASNLATETEPVIGFPIVSGGNMWVGDRRLSKYEIQTSRGKLARQWVKDDGDTFVGPLHVFGNVVLGTLQRVNSSGISVITRDVSSGNQVWQTDLGVAAARIIVNPETRKTVAVSAGGALFEINAASVQQGYNDQPLLNVGSSAGSSSFTQAVEMGDGRYAFASPRDARRAVVYDPSRSSGQLGVINLKVASAETRTTCPPQAFAGGLLMPLSNGQVSNLDLVTGDDHLLPFQPGQQAGTSVVWRGPALLGDGQREFVIVDDSKNLTRVGIGDKPRPHLKALASVQLEFDIVSPLAATPDAVFGVSRPGNSDTVVAFSIADLKVVKEFPLQGRVTWGPHRVGSEVYLTTDVDGLICFEAGPNLRWKSPLSHGPLAGPPVPNNGQLLLASQQGIVWTVDAATGQETGTPIDVGEPLGAEPVIFPNGLLLPGSDGAVHLVSPSE